MKISSKIALVIGILGLFSANVMAIQILKEIYKPHDANLKFKRGKQELNVSIELQDKGRIEYKADLLGKN